MNPTPSTIAFTTSSGLGFGVLIILPLGSLLGMIPADRWFGLVTVSFALAAVTAGFITSTFHLGRRERLLMALSEWRSSWLSRQALMAIFTYVPSLFFGLGLIIYEAVSGFFAVMALATALGAALTVCCTGMIYASLPPISAWHHRSTTPIFLGFALATGSLTVHFLAALFGLPTLWIGLTALILTLAAFGLKTARWHRFPKEGVSATMASATGLGSFGIVRLLDPPYTETNPLLNGIGFKIGRKHARQLRSLVYFVGFAGSVTFTILALVLNGVMITLMSLLALACGIIGVLLERWLFFAEAEHTAQLYLGDATTARRKASPAATAPMWEKKETRRKPSGPQRRPITAKISGNSSR